MEGLIVLCFADWQEFKKQNQELMTQRSELRTSLYPITPSYEDFKLTEYLTAMEVSSVWTSISPQNGQSPHIKKTTCPLTATHLDKRQILCSPLLV